MPEIEFNVDNIAKLAMLDLTDEQRVLFTEQLPSIMAYVSKLHEVDTSEISSSAYLTDLVNIVQADEVLPSSEELRADLIKAFPCEKGDALEVPAIFE
ncbi:MAG: Aspartyl/glutamyl-tRNA(Asn/Gln) amidotransferase subunit C [Candidatus Uhrbacteria bacterium GW2011_GWD1_41_16]|uniref:Aspartyl/glutamyl-tRNA(Asn/Gln) amidotransferase subunit C n=1 Tax=Candidatus Uhrbacteria bacterium GW2011_GWC1_41_20 TaxID=1618983 RepID=A0A0G0VIJ4_9BACT|nr:MAG: Aspartyl/glutamyl-tRNA(Asn/Gln) amidotransferase subunit C [Candidatus Uhrbacteria bacterium GW2011_GWE1_39_46]KKR63640.1 MAG: Aspartyl/glutamyl-tRNA(Asn/Gln) amidotransferase subunit C [Candidatus Uhrbacteria bacterium GW2011_GWC2_40_450]KKR89409.1 MAG: Aspartyl/glutamyl-tRNA(Asn/Gln) amidotransferase subunit C [Candidatus Uhrbacteria bacterium GW2011_GWE2_41_1153]KKR96412.1 MAG: Aspartyl/glutamyl-tRNA(Asn/Gln) amidotransferase subunit C [Candidatus Uhrbacteria bacterium GW2011_GWD1_41_